MAPSANNGDQLQTVSGAAAWITPGISINSITGTTYIVAAADRGARDQFTGTAASAWTLAKAGSAGFGNNFFFTVPNFSANNVNVTITPTTSNCNGGLNCIVGQGQIAYLTSDPTANSGNGSYYAHIGWNTLSSGSFVTITPNQFGGTVDLTAAVPISLGGTGKTTQQDGFNALAPTPTRAGDITYYDGTNYVNLAGNNSGTGCFQENSSGVPSFGTCGGSPTLDQVGNPAASKTFTMGANSLAFNWTTNAFNLDTAGATPTFGLASYTAAVTNSPTLTIAGSYQNSATPTFAEDSFGFQNVIGAGTNGTAQLTVTPAGTTGAAGYTFNISGAAGSDGNFIVQNGAHNLSIEPNNPSNGQVLTPTDNFNITMASGKNLTVGGGGGASVTAFSNCGATAANNCFTIKEGAASPTGTTFRTINSSSVLNFGILKGIVSNYNSIATVDDGVPSEVAHVVLTAQGAAITATTAYAVPAGGAGEYEVCFNSKVTQAATTSSTLGGATGFQIIYTDKDDSVVVTTASGSVFNSTTTDLALNTTQAQYNGCAYINAKASTNIQYAIGYTSSGATPMQFNLHIKVKAE